MRKICSFFTVIGILLCCCAELTAGTPVKGYGLQFGTETVQRPQTWTQFQLGKSRTDTVSGKWLSVSEAPVPVALSGSGMESEMTMVSIGFDFPYAGKTMTHFGLTGDGFVYLSDKDAYKPVYSSSPEYDNAISRLVIASPVYSDYGTAAAFPVMTDSLSRIAYRTEAETLTLAFDSLLFYDKDLGAEAVARLSYDLVFKKDGSIKLVFRQFGFQEAATTQWGIIFGIKGLSDEPCVYAGQWQATGLMPYKSMLPIVPQPGKNSYIAFQYPETCVKPQISATVQFTNLLPTSADFNVLMGMETDYDGALVFLADRDDVSERPEDGKVYKCLSYDLSGNDSIGEYVLRYYGENPQYVHVRDLKPNTEYFIYVYPFADACDGGPAYQSDPVVLDFRTPENPPSMEVVSVGKNAAELAFSLAFPDDEILLGMSRRKFYNDKHILDPSGKSYEVGDTLYYEPEAEYPTPGGGSKYIEVVHIGKVEDGKYLLEDLDEAGPYYLYVWKKYGDTLFTSQYSYAGLHTLEVTPVDFRFTREALCPDLPAGWMPVEGIEGHFQVGTVSAGGMYGLPAPEESPMDKDICLNGTFISSDPRGGGLATVGAVSPLLESSYGILDVLTYLNVFEQGMGSVSLLPFGNNDTLWIEYKSEKEEDWIPARMLTKEDALEYAGNYACVRTRIASSVGDRLRLRYIAKGMSATGWSSRGININHVRIEPGLPCSYPGHIAVNDSLTTHRSVALDFVDENNPSATVIYRYREEGAGPWSSYRKTERTGGLTCSPLVQHTLHTFELRSVCRSGDSSLVQTVSASTMRSLPFEQTFTDMQAGESMPSDFMSFYALLPETGAVQVPDQSSTYGGFQPGAGTDLSHTALGMELSTDDFWLLFPSLCMENQIAPASLTFRMAAYERNLETGNPDKVPADHPSYILVLVSEDAQYEVSDVVDTIFPGECGTSYQTYTLDLTGHTGQLRIALAAQNPAIDYEKDYGRFFVMDSIRVDYTGDIPCLGVENIKQYDLDKTGISLSWTGYSMEYGIYYTDKGTQKTDTVYTRQTEYRLENLNPGTLYTYRIQSFCEEGHRSPGDLSKEGFFTTQEICSVPTRFGIVEVTWQSVTLTAHSNTGKILHIWAKDEDRYPTIDYYFDLSPQKDTAIVSGLTEQFNIDYMVSVRNVCGIGDSSQWAEPLSFKTEPAVCGKPADLASQVGETSAELSWKPALNNDYFWLMYKPVSRSFFDTVDVVIDHYVLNGLQENTAYVWQVQAICGKILASPVAEAGFTTLGAGVEPERISSFLLSSQAGRIRIFNPGHEPIDRVEIFSVNGRSLYVSDFDTRDNVLLPVLPARNQVVMARIHSRGRTATYKLVLM